MGHYSAGLDDCGIQDSCTAGLRYLCFNPLVLVIVDHVVNPKSTALAESARLVDCILQLVRKVMKMNANQSLEKVLQAAVIAAWPDLTRDAQTNLIHIEYNFAPDGTLDDLQIWLSLTRGHWLLVCEYWMAASNSHQAGIRFENNYESKNLARSLESIMQHQNEFSLPADLGRQGLLQITMPT